LITPDNSCGHLSQLVASEKIKKNSFQFGPKCGGFAGAGDLELFHPVCQCRGVDVKNFASAPGAADFPIFLLQRPDIGFASSIFPTSTIFGA